MANQDSTANGSEGYLWELEREKRRLENDGMSGDDPNGNRNRGNGNQAEFDSSHGQGLPKINWNRFQDLNSSSFSNVQSQPQQFNDSQFGPVLTEMNLGISHDSSFPISSSSSSQSSADSREALINSNNDYQNQNQVPYYLPPQSQPHLSNFANHGTFITPHNSIPPSATNHQLLPPNSNPNPNPYQLSPERYQDLIQQQLDHLEEHDGDSTRWYPNPNMNPNLFAPSYSLSSSTPSTSIQQSFQPQLQTHRHSFDQSSSFPSSCHQDQDQNHSHTSLQHPTDHPSLPQANDFRSQSFSFGDSRHDGRNLLDSSSLNQFDSTPQLDQSPIAASAFQQSDPFDQAHRGVPGQSQSQAQAQPVLQFTTSKGKQKPLQTHSQEEEVIQELDQDGVERQDEEGDEGALKKRKAVRRQGVTCDLCRSNHIKCDLREVKEAQTGTPDGNVQRNTKTMKEEFKDFSCTRCTSKKVECTKNFTAAPRNYPRPARSGKRIEQARLQHGTSTPTSNSTSTLTKSSIESRGFPLNPGVQLVFPSKSRGEAKISSNLVGGWIAVHLLTCFFQSAYTQMPIIDATNFSKRFNTSNGNLKIMVLMANGGDEGFESAIPTAPGLKSLEWEDTKESKISTIDTLETLIASMQAAASHYSDAPTIFGPEGSKYLAGRRSPHSLSRNQSTSSLSSSENASNKPSGKRKQGVACDPCRLRRVKCDYWEKNSNTSGFSCSRCETKGINCTAEFIQSRIAKGSNPNPNANSSNSSPNTSFGNLSPTSFGNQDASDNPTEAPTAHFKEKDYNPEHMIALGKLRKPFCLQLLFRALDLVEKRDLLFKPSVEAVQSLMILAPVLAANDMLLKSREFAAAACRHLKALNLEPRFTADENDPVSIPRLLIQIQAQRLANTTWCFDSFWAAIYRVVPHLPSDEPVTFSNRRPTSLGEIPAFVAPLRSNSVALSGYGDSGVALVASRLAPIQSCALSRFIARNIDNVQSTSIQDLSPEQRFPPSMNLSEIQRLSNSCHAFWKAVFSLLSNSDIFISKALKGEEKFEFKESNPILPISWTSTTQISFVSLLLSVYRVLGERLKIFGTSVQIRGARARSGMGLPPSMEEMDALKELKVLFEISKSRTLLACRRSAHLTAWLLPRHVFNTGFLRRQLVPISQFLANAATQPSSPSSTESSPNPQISGLTASRLPSPTGNSPNSQHSNSSSRPSNQDSQSGFSKDDVSSIMDHLKKPNEDLGDFTITAKQIEVGWILEGIKALAYAWSDCEKHVQTAEMLLKRSLEAESRVSNVQQTSR